MIFRANSEMAVASSVESVDTKPNSVANSRPFCRAATTSASVLIVTTASLATGRMSLRFLVQKCKPFFQIQGCVHSLQRQAELNHRKCYFRLNPHDYGFCPTQPGHMSQVAQGARGKRVHHVEHRDIHDDSPSTELADLLSQRVSQMHQIEVAEGGLDGGNEI